MTINKRISRLKEVMAMTKLSRSTIYAWVDAGIFPRPIKLGERAVGWLTHEVEGWIESRIEESRTA